ncbi:MAG: class I SAM-dependent methyltransferase [Patescibacteria group bacterium]|nr:class I SAM-dependent methyltransferase [Patescibacteria group bacterium]
MTEPRILTTGPSDGYELLDSGEGEKLERFGGFVLARPDPQALWPKRLPKARWAAADAYFTRDEKSADWAFRKELPASWPASFAGLNMLIKPTAFKHTGLFPEQAPNWEWLRSLVAKRGARGPRPSVLNLFGYTGGATLACASAGAEAAHIDGSKSAVSWARENAALSGLKDAPIRWIVEDARTFVEREARRGRTYDGILMDPPAFGRGPSGEVWKIEEHLLPLIEGCRKLLSPDPLFFLINGYSAGYSAIAYGNDLLPLAEDYGGTIEIGELAVAEAGEKGRLLPAGIFARWSRE